MKQFFIVALCVVGVVLGITFFVPLSTNSVDIISLQKAPETFTLEPGAHLSQRIRIPKGTYSGITLYSSEPTIDGRALYAYVEDKSGNRLASGSTVKTSYSKDGDKLVIEMPLSWFSVAIEDFYLVDISLSHGEAISLYAMGRDTNSSRSHMLKSNDVSKPMMVAISVSQKIPAIFGLRQGILIGSAFFLAVVLISQIQNQQKKYWSAIAIIIVFAPLAVLGFWYSAGPLGIADWDLYFTLHDSYRKAILEYHQFPFWNPYICGGTAGLGDPEFPVFSPTFLLELLFGIPVGIKFAITLSVIVGATGMLALAKSLGRSVEAGLIAALAVAFGTVNILEITEGHVNVMAAMWIPWILWAWLGVYRGTKKPIICGIFLAATFLGGGIYLLMYTTFAFLFLILAVRDHRRAVWKTVQAGSWALGFASIKLAPVLLWLKQFPDDAYATSAYTLPWIGEILFGRHIHGAYVIFQQNHGWHEYGAYIGYVVFTLALIGISRFRKNRVIAALGVSAVGVVVLSALGPYLVPVFDPLWFFPRSNISRVILFAIIPLSLLASFGVDTIAKTFPNKGKALRVLLVGIIAIDIISLTYQLSEQAFILPHVVPSISPAPKPIAYTPERYDESGSGSRTTRSYDAYKAGYGTLAYCSVLGPKSAVGIISDEYGSAAVSATDPNARISINSWSFHTIQVNVEAPEKTEVLVNANYVYGWTVNGEPASEVAGRVAANVEAGSQMLVFSYKPPGFVVGLVITFCTVLVALFWKRRYD